jgi:putative transposase
MPSKGHSEEQIVAVLRQAEVGEKVVDICRRMSISPATFYTWRKQYTGLGIAELRELRQLRDENNRLKRLVADISLDQQILRKIVSKELYGLVNGASWPVVQRKATRPVSAEPRS